MALFGKLFGTKKNYPPLEPENPISQRLEEIRQPLETLAHEVKDQLEVVPAEKAAYVFIGKPPKKFGIAWVQDGEVFNLKIVADKQAIPPDKIQKTSERLRSAYERSESDKRYSTSLGDQMLVVAASERLEEEVDKIISDFAT